MTTEEKLKEACEIINTLRIDAEMALCGDWDKGDEGFESQINLIDDFFYKIDYRAEVYEPEDDDDDDENDDDTFFLEDGIEKNLDEIIEIYDTES